MSGSYPRKSVSNFIITLYAKLYQIVIETNLICDVIIINNKIRHNSFTIFTTRRNSPHRAVLFAKYFYTKCVAASRPPRCARGKKKKKFWKKKLVREEKVVRAPTRTRSVNFFGLISQKLFLIIILFCSCLVWSFFKNVTMRCKTASWGMILI